MASSNPAFNRSPAFSSNRDVAAKLQAGATGSVSTEGMTAAQLTDLYSVPSATPSDTDRMTYEDTMVKIVTSFVILLVGHAIGVRRSRRGHAVKVGELGRRHALGRHRASRASLQFRGDIAI